MTQLQDLAPPDSRARREARDWLVRLSAGQVSPELLQQFRAWQAASASNAQAFAQERAFWQQLEGLRAPMPQAVPPRIGRRSFLAGGAALAAGVGVLAAPHVLQWWQADFATGVGGRADLTLPDGSLATLNTDSAIALAFADGAREVTLLKGEAAFTVADAAQAPFRVQALNGQSLTQGAAFSVMLAGDQARITVAAGQVRVSSGPSKTGIDLSAAQQTVYGPGMQPAKASAVDAEMAFAWQQGRIIFDGRRFDEAVAELGRYIPERIVLRAGVDPALPVSAVFSTADARAALDALAKTQGLPVRRIPHVMIMLG